MNVFELFAKLSLDTSDYDKGLSNAEGSASSFGSKLKKGVGVAAGVTTAAIAATTAATVAGTKAFIDGVSTVAQYGDNIDKMSQKMNISAEAYQEWDFVMQHCGASIESLKPAMKTLATQAETSAEYFDQLGMSQEEIANMSQEELFGATISALQNVEDETQRTYLASKLLGRGATELGALFNMTAEETAEMRQQVHELGGVMSDEAVKDAARFQDSLQNMQTAFDGVKRSMLSNFLPGFATVMDGLAKVFSGDSDGGLGIIKEGVKNVADNMAKVAPVFIEVGGTIIQSLAMAIVENLPLLIKSGLNAITSIIDGIVENIDMIIDAAEQVISTFIMFLLDPERAAKLMQAAIDIIVKLSNGLIEALPQLLPAIVEVIVAIVTTLTSPDNLNMLIDCSLKLLIALANGIVEALPELVAVIPTVIFNLVEALVDNFPEVISTTLYLIGALGYAILKALGALLGQTAFEITEALSGMFDKAFNFGKQIGAWLANGVNNIKTKVSNFFSNIISFFTNGFQNIRQKVNDGLENIKSKFTGIFDNVRNVVKNAIDFIRGLFHFDWELPKIKLPHFSVTGKLDLLATPPQIPSVSIEWYKKAMDKPYLLDGATIFGAANGKLLGGGESGSELVIGTDKLMKMIKSATGENSRPITMNVYGAVGQDVRQLAKEVSRELQNLINDKEKVYA